MQELKHGRYNGYAKIAAFRYNAFFIKDKYMRPILLSILLPVFAVSCSGSPQKGNVASHVPSQEEASDTILQQAIYTREDSVRVERLLRMECGSEDVLFYARQFIGVPYVASTLEVADPERLVVNLRQLDCTTLVETTLALALTKRQGSDNFSDYCRNLLRIRYWGGWMNGYLSRLHYFTWWMHDNIAKGVVGEVSDSVHFTAVVNVDNHYMSAHSEKYKFLKGRAERVDSIRVIEERFNGPDGHYLPAGKTGMSRRELDCIKNGDVIAIVTTKDGIDYSHLGFAVWGKDGRLHLLNASSIHHKVVEEPKTLRQYLREHPSSVGIRLLRLR